MVTTPQGLLENNRGGPTEISATATVIDASAKQEFSQVKPAVDAAVAAVYSLFETMVLLLRIDLFGDRYALV